MRLVSFSFGTLVHRNMSHVWKKKLQSRKNWISPAAHFTTAQRQRERTGFSDEIQICVNDLLIKSFFSLSFSWFHHRKVQQQSLSVVAKVKFSIVISTKDSSWRNWITQKKKKKKEGRLTQSSECNLIDCSRHESDSTCNKHRFDWSTKRHWKWNSTIWKL